MKLRQYYLLLSGLLVSLIFAIDCEAQSKLSYFYTFNNANTNNFNNKDEVKIYMAASLFNGRETRFNLDLTESLEKKYGYKAYLPQRDGFEFRKLITTIAQKILTKQEVENAIKSIIYLLDMGIFIHNSDIIVANLDDILDEGVAVELTYARLIGKPVIGFRTDVRTPYSFDANPATGAHFFVTFQCNYLIWLNMPSKKSSESELEMQNLSSQIAKTIELEKSKFGKGLAAYATSNPIVQKIQNGANLLYEGIDDIHTERNIEEVVRRFSENKNTFQALLPNLSVVTVAH